MSFRETRGPIYDHTEMPSTGNAASVGTHSFFVARNKCKITAVYVLPSAAVTADGTNYAVYTLTRHTAGASATSVATRSWIATNSVALVEESGTLSGTAANLLLAVGDTLSVVKSVAGTGLVVPAARIGITYELTGV